MAEDLESDQERGLETEGSTIFTHLEENFKSAIDVYKKFNTSNLPVYFGFALIVAFSAFLLSQLSSTLFSSLGIGNYHGNQYSFLSLAYFSTFSVFYGALPILAIGLFAQMIKGENLRGSIGMSKLFSNVSTTMWKNLGICVLILMVCSLLVPNYFEFDTFGNLGRAHSMKSFFYDLLALLYSFLPFYLVVIWYHSGDGTLKFVNHDNKLKIIASILMLITIHYMATAIVSIAANQSSGLIEALANNRRIGSISEVIVAFVASLFVLPAKARAIGPSKSAPKDLEEEFQDSDVIDDVL